jgi:hypothetical protein
VEPRGRVGVRERVILMGRVRLVPGPQGAEAEPAGTWAWTVALRTRDWIRSVGQPMADVALASRGRAGEYVGQKIATSVPLGEGQIGESGPG